MTEVRSGSIDTYRLAGLRLASEVPLSGLLLQDSEGSDVDATIRYGSVSEELADPIAVDDGVVYDGSSLLLTIPDVARYLVRNGREIVVDPDPRADKNDIRAYLLGSAFGTLCHQRGLLPLHSAAIDVAGGCVTFIGFSGAGKSTLAAALSGRGHQVIADDVSFLFSDSNGHVMSWPGIGRIRLWEDAVAALACNGPDVEREVRGYNKYLIPVRPPHKPFAARRLLRIYRLGADLAGSTASVRPVRGALRIEFIMQNIYCLRFAECIVRKPAIFGFCADVARRVPLFEFSRPFGFGAFREGIDVLEEHLRELR